MTGKCIITRDHLAQLGACESGMDFFDQTYPEGKAEYQDMLDKAVAGGRTDYAAWLLEEVGPTEDVLEVEEINSKELDVVFAGRVCVKLGIIVRRLIAGWGIEAGCGIEAGEGIKAGCGIKADWGIEAGWGIKAGCGIEAGWGIEAGEGIKAGCGIEAGWGIEAGCGIEAGEGIKAGCGIKADWGIEAGWGIKAGCGIKAGWGIEAGEGIKAGWEHGIYAGLRVKVTNREYRAIRAKNKPDNIMCGEWMEQ